VGGAGDSHVRSRVFGLYGFRGALLGGSAFNGLLINDTNHQGRDLCIHDTLAGSNC